MIAVEETKLATLMRFECRSQFCLLALTLRTTMDLDIPAVATTVIFYVVITIVGIWAARVTRNRKSKNASDTMIVGGQDIGIILGTCTITGK